MSIVSDAAPNPRITLRCVALPGHPAEYHLTLYPGAPADVLASTAEFLSETSQLTRTFVKPDGAVVHVFAEADPDTPADAEAFFTDVEQAVPADMVNARAEAVVAGLLERVASAQAHAAGTGPSAEYEAGWLAAVTTAGEHASTDGIYSRGYESGLLAYAETYLLAAGQPFTSPSGVGAA